ncbi:MAG TPA: response regulator [Steroidobacteraceae bacterium]|jgi:CheY-like chemotaxis protein
MTHKRALIVDDSRSARVILSRMLEAYDLEVDAAESAEQALEHLKQARPDVIFMDHLMPGMDGFQAIQAIKSNPDTAMIPVMMYTSQEGELYVSQARALGAVGVLPKTVKQGDVSRILYQLRLLPERREGRAPVFTPLGEIVEEMREEPARVHAERPPVAVPGEIESAVRHAVTEALKEHHAELRRFMLANFEAFARRIAPDGKPVAVTTEQQEIVELAPPEPPRTRWPLLATVASIALLPTIVLAVLYTRTLSSIDELKQSNALQAAVVQEQASQLALLREAARTASAEQHAAVLASTTSGTGMSEVVPYGEAPLSGSRLERLRGLIESLKASNFHGKLKIAAYVGEFCLTGNGIEGYSVASDDLPVRRCDLVGNPFDDGLPTTQRQSVPFANLVASARQQIGDGLKIEIDYSGRHPAVPYPEGDQLSRATAGDWNRIAMQNNRVEFVTEPATAVSLAGS